MNFTDKLYNVYNGISNSITNTQYNIRSNLTDYHLFSISYVFIGITTVVLACATILDTEGKEGIDASNTTTTSLLPSVFTTSSSSSDEDLGTKITKGANETFSNLVESGEELVSNINEKGTGIVSGITEKGSELLSGMTEKGSELLSGMTEKGSELLTGITEKSKDYIPAVLQTEKKMTGGRRKTKGNKKKRVRLNKTGKKHNR